MSMYFDRQSFIGPFSMGKLIKTNYKMKKKGEIEPKKEGEKKNQEISTKKKKMLKSE